MLVFVFGSLVVTDGYGGACDGCYRRRIAWGPNSHPSVRSWSRSRCSGCGCRRSRLLPNELLQQPPVHSDLFLYFFEAPIYSGLYFSEAPIYFSELPIYFSEAPIHLIVE